MQTALTAGDGTMQRSREEFAEEAFLGFSFRSARRICGRRRGGGHWICGRRFIAHSRCRLACFQERVELEEFAAEGAAVAGPLVVAGGRGERDADGGELGIEIVEVVEDHRFANHRQLRRAEFVLAVMADQQVLHDGLQRRAESLRSCRSRAKRFRVPSRCGRAADPAWCSRWRARSTALRACRRRAKSRQ